MPERVVIIGGGLAGMAAAHALADSAAEVLVLEARRRPGGRAGSFEVPGHHEPVDYCQHVAMGCCTNFCHLIAAHGLAEEFTRIRSLEFLGLDGTVSRFAPTPGLPAPFHLAPAFSRLRFLRREERTEVRRAVWRLMRQPPQAVRSETTFATWLRQQGQSSETIARFWNVVIASALGEDTTAVAYAPARKVFVDGFLASPTAGEVWIPRLPLSELFGVRLAASLQGLGVRLRSGAAAAEIVREAGRVRGVRLRNGERLPADAVIVAVPWHRLGRLLDPPLIAQLFGTAAGEGDDPNGAVVPFADWNSSPISGVHLWFDRPITERRQAVIVSGLSQWLFQPFVGGSTEAVLADAEDPPGAPPKSPSSHYYQVVVSASRELQRLGQEAAVATIQEELATLFPAARQSRLLHWKVVTDPQAVFSVSPQTERTRPPQRTGHPDLFLAGDYTQTGWPATMEGAVISGFRAAAALGNRFGWACFAERPPLSASSLSRLLIRSAAT
jgi:squalene-associated FAD-dependent desaturase